MGVALILRGQLCNAAGNKFSSASLILEAKLNELPSRRRTGMNQDLIEQAAGGTGFQTGTICTDSNIYRCSDDFFEIIEYVEAGKPFPKGPFGNGKGNTVWRKITLATDGTRKTINGAKTTV
jgi:hypothetical protein